MAITAINRDYGDAVSMVRITTTDTLAAVGTTGYILAQQPNIIAVNSGPFSWQTSDFALVYASNGWGFFNISADFNSLVAFAFSTSVSTPVVVGDFATFSSTSGNLEDSGYLPSNAAYTRVAMSNTPTIANQLAMFNDTAGSITDSGITVVDGGIVPSASNGLTAHAGGGQTSALALTSTVNRVTTVASAGDSVKLPVSVAGLSVTVINNGANAMQVFGASTDTINGIATGTGISQIPNSVVRYVSAVAGLWQTQDVNFGYSSNFPTSSVSTGLTAHSGGGQGSALALTSSVNNITTAAASGDSVRLPVSAVGMAVTVINSGANPIQVFGAGTDTVNGIATATGVSQLPGSTVTYRVAVVGNWLANLVASANITQYLEVPLTAAQFNGMYAAPVSLIPAQGANTLIVIDQMQLVMTFGSADYAAGGPVAAQYGSTTHGGGPLATNAEAAADFFAAASTTFLFNGTFGNTVGALPFSTTGNTAVYLSNTTGAFTTGDSTWIVKLFYRVISLNS